jgi:hypothetical protein
LAPKLEIPAAYNPLAPPSELPSVRDQIETLVVLSSRRTELVVGPGETKCTWDPLAPLAYMEESCK